MAYNSYFPQYYQNAMPQQMQQPMPMMQQTPQQASTPSNNGITWVQGENAAKSFPVGAGQSVLLMDSEDSVMYIKSTDQSGMPQPLRIFDYTERKSPNGDVKQPELSLHPDKFVSREEFEEFREDVKRSIKGIRKPKLKDEEDE